MKSDFLNTIFGQKSRLSAITLLAGLLLLIPIRGFGQTGCVNPATIALSSTSGSTCGTRSITIRDNIFGGSAKDVRITHNGEGSVSPTSTSNSPFSFKYTPDKDDRGKTVIITVTTNDPPGPCEAVKTTYSLYVSAYPSEPDVGRITQPSCTEPTGSVVLSGLPATGTWTINPVGFQGSGTTATVTGLAKGEYEFTVTNSYGCTSTKTDDIDIDAPPPVPSSPITTVDCAQGLDKAVVRVSSPTGSGLTYRLDNGSYQSSTTFSNVANGDHTITVRNSSGCTTTGALFSVSCGCVTPPTVSLSSNQGSTCAATSITVSGNTFGGSASGVLITGNGKGTLSPATSNTQPFAFTYVPAAEDAGNTVTITVTTVNPPEFPCEAVKATYSLVVLASPSAPVVGAITQPTCAVATGTVVLSGLPATGNWTINPVGFQGSGTSTFLTGLNKGEYEFTVTNSFGCTSNKTKGIDIEAPPPVPSSPISTVDCSQGLNRAVVRVSSPTGSGLTYRLDNGSFQSSTTFSNVSNGDHTITVRNSSGCTSTGALFSVSCGCVTPPTVSLSSNQGSTCATTPITVSGNTFGGSASGVLITGNGGGTLSPATTNTQPYAFTYVPAAEDAGKTVTITVTTVNPPEFPCGEAKATYSLQVLNSPSIPVVGAITHPTCTVATGSVAFSGLPESGTWSLTRTPGGVTISGTGTNTVISGLVAGSYEFTVTNSFGCTSNRTNGIAIDAPPPVPSSPINTVDCTQGLDKAVVRVTSPTGAGLTYRLDNGSYQSSATFTNVSNGNHSVTVRNSSGCTATGALFSISCGCVNPPTVSLSSNQGSTCATTPITVSGNTFGGSASGVLITGNGGGTLSPATTNTQPYAFTYVPAAEDAGKTVTITVTTINPPGLPCGEAKATYSLTVLASPSAPVVGAITQPTCGVATGSVALSGLPESGTWSLTRTPGGITIAGTGTSIIISGLVAGEYEFTVTNSFGCTSKSSSNVIINASTAIPTLIINHPPAVCFPLKVDLTAPSVTSGSTPGLTYTYWSDINATVQYTTPATADGGTYFIKGTTESGCSVIKPVTATVNTLPIANAGAGSNECGLNFTFNAVATNGLGTWSKVSGPGSVTFSPNANTANALVTVTDYGSYTFRWTIVDGACSNSATVQVNFIQQIPANAGSGGYECDNDFIFNASPTSGTGTWTKISGTGNAVFTPDRFQPDAKVVVDQFGSYDFAWTEVNNICSSTDIVRVIFRELPALNGGNDTTICRGTAIQFNALGMGFFDWTPVTFISNPYIPNPVAIPDTTTVFTVTLTDQFGCKSTDAVKVEVREMPVANAGEDQILSGQKSTLMNARLDHDYEIGRWSVLSGKGDIYNMSDGRTEIDGLSSGKNQFLWTVSNRVCPASLDTVSILVHAFFIPTLITPNQDGRNDYFVITGLDIDSRTELMIFDRQGIQVYRNPDYDNTWDGTDDKKRPLREDTYFYVLKPANSEPVKGFFVIRR